MNIKSNEYALVTGASQGLGREIAIELAAQGFNILLTALPHEGLADFAEILENSYAVRAEYMEADLSDEDMLRNVAEWAEEFPVKVLVNNAGIGGTMAFAKAQPDYIDLIIQLNVRAPALLSRLLLPQLQKMDSAYILNVSSMAAFSPMAYKTVYPASKAFIWSFSRGLYEELKSSRVFVGVIHPGPIKTNSEVCKRIDQQKFFGRLGQVSPQKLARIAVQQLFNKDSLLIPGFMNKINWLMIQIVPVWIRLGLLSKVVQREIPKPDNNSFS